MLVTLGLQTWVVGLMIALFLFVCIILILTVLIQRPQGGGLSGAFGSNSGSGQTAFGAKTGDALTIATIGMFVIYVFAAIGLNYAVRPPSASSTTPTLSSTSPTDATTTPAGTPEGAVPVEGAPAGETPGTGVAPTDMPASTDPAVPPTGATPTEPGTPPAAAPAIPAPAPVGEPAPATPAPTPAPTPPTQPPATPPGGGQ